VNPHIEKAVWDLVFSWANGGPDSVVWYKEAAIECIYAKRFVAIPTRDGAGLYLLRCWLTAPLTIVNHDGTTELESGDSVLLHFFARGDDDQSLHDHPWDFVTDILSGGYVEHLPPIGWSPTGIAGPSWNVRHVDHRHGERISHHAEDLHCVGHVDPGTWTLVRTGPRRRPWGFHPPGEPWIDADQFFARKTDRIARANA
jgi:hypothetical protein